MSVFRALRPFPSLTRATEAPGGLSLGFSPLCSHSRVLTRVNATLWAIRINGYRACVRSFVARLAIDTVLKYASYFIHESSFLLESFLNTHYETRIPVP